MTATTEANALDLRELRVHLRPGDRRSRRRHPARNRLRGHPQRLVLPRLRSADLRLPPAGAGRGLEPRRQPGAPMADLRLRLAGGRAPASGAPSRPCGWPRRATRSRCSSAAAASATRTSPSRPCANRAATSGCRKLGHARRPADDLLQGRLRRLRQRRRRRQPRLRQHPLPGPPGLLRGPAVGASSATGRRELAPHYDTAERMLGVVEYEGMGPADKLLQEYGEEIGVGETFTNTRSASSSTSRASRSPTPSSKARGRRAPAACAAAAAWSAAATAPRTR